jgi:hypothetical protein
MNTSAIAQPSWLERRRMGKTAHRFGVMSAIGFGGSYYTMSAIERPEHMILVFEQGAFTHSLDPDPTEPNRRYNR